MVEIISLRFIYIYIVIRVAILPDVWLYVSPHLHIFHRMALQQHLLNFWLHERDLQTPGLQCRSSKKKNYPTQNANHHAVVFIVNALSKNCDWMWHVSGSFFSLWWWCLFSSFGMMTWFDQEDFLKSYCHLNPFDFKCWIHISLQDLTRYIG